MKSYHLISLFHNTDISRENEKNWKDNNQEKNRKIKENLEDPLTLHLWTGKAGNTPGYYGMYS